MRISSRIISWVLVPSVIILGILDVISDKFNIPPLVWTVSLVASLIMWGIYTWAFELSGKTIKMINDEYLSKIKRKKNI